jgi:hypothetical protein
MSTDNNVATPAAPAPLRAEAPGGATIGLATLAGLGAAIAGAALWAVVTVLTSYELGIMAIAVGFMVGRAIIFVAKSGNATLGIIGAVCALFGCVLGNLFSAVGFAAQAWNASYFDVLTHLNIDLATRLMTVSFGAMDLIFYAIGIYEGYRFSSRA